MSKEVFEPIRQGLEEALAMVESPEFVLHQQRAVLKSSLRLFSMRYIRGDEMAEALERFIDFKIALASQAPPSPHTEKGE